MKSYRGRVTTPYEVQRERENQLKSTPIAKVYTNTQVGSSSSCVDMLSPASMLQCFTHMKEVCGHTYTKRRLQDESDQRLTAFTSSSVDDDALMFVLLAWYSSRE